MNKKEIKSWLDKMKIKNYSINDDLTVNVNGDVCISCGGLIEIPVQFNKVSGNFWCIRNQLTTLEGAPRSIGHDFCCDNNQLTTLKGAPKSVGGNFWCHYNQLTSLEGVSSSIGGHFLCYNNQLTTLKGAPRSVGNHFYCSNNPLKSLEGKPNYVKGKFFIDLAIYNRIFRKDKEWSLDDVDEIPAGNINIKDEIYG